MHDFSSHISAEFDRIVVLTNRVSPTYGYFIAPRLRDEHHVIAMTESDVRHDVELRPGDYVLVCRYVPIRWLMKLARRDDLAGIGLVVDDNMAALMLEPGMPLIYRLQVGVHGLFSMKLLSSRISDVFVSTPKVAEVYQRMQPRVLRPIPSTDDISPPRKDQSGPVRIAFHAKLNHLRDHAFAARIMSEVARNVGNVEIDIVGPSRVNSTWRDIPNVRFRPEMDWPDYRTHTAQDGADILIAPMLDTKLNHARAPTKAIDAVRMGAAAILPNFEGFKVLDGIVDLVAPNAEDWASAITTLASDRKLIEKKAAALHRAVSEWQSLAC